MRILLQFAPEQSPVHNARLAYAFRLFCSIYGHEPFIGCARDHSPDVTLTYEQNPEDHDSICLTKVDLVRPLSQPAPDPIMFSKNGDQTALFYHPSEECEPDWLAEIFEWVSCADEYSCKQRDLVGRVPFGSAYVGRHGLNLRVPYAAVAMALLQKAIARIKPQASLRPQSPSASVQHFVVNTHDVDFLPKDVVSSSYRLAKNALISLFLYKSGRAAAAQSASAVTVLFGGRDPLDQIALLAQRERSQQTSASYYFLCGGRHRRDGNYSIQSASTLDLMHTLEEAEQMEVGVHGSYRCMEHAENLAAEFDELRGLGFHAIGGRQHWLRFTIPQLVRAVQRADAAYDASIGWPYDSGFRAGACFAFPPYDFESEAPAPFLELPLVVMDGGLRTGNRGTGNHDSTKPQAVAEILAASRHYGWGGISLLWHPTAFGGGQYPPELGDCFWKLLGDGHNSSETWLSAASFVRSVWQRYQNVGLLPGWRWR
jgi:hypothetical protein